MTAISMSHPHADTSSISIVEILKKLSAGFGKWLSEVMNHADDSNAVGARGL